MNSDNYAEEAVYISFGEEQPYYSPTSEPVLQPYHYILGFSLFVFLLYLIIPRGLKKQCIKTDRRIYAKSNWLVSKSEDKISNNDLEEQWNDNLSVTDSYVSLSELTSDEADSKMKHRKLLARRKKSSTLPLIRRVFIDTCSVYTAESADYDKLSPLENLQFGSAFGTIFRRNEAKAQTLNEETPLINNKRKSQIGSQQHENVQLNNILDQKRNANDETPTINNKRTSYVAQQIRNRGTTPDSLFSAQTSMLSLDYSDDVSKDDKENVINHHQTHETRLIHSDVPHIVVSPRILVEIKTPNEILNKRNYEYSEEINKSNHGSEIKTPYSRETRNTDDKSTSMNFTPSPLSFVPQNEKNVVVLISSKILFADQEIQQKKALDLLLSNNFPCDVTVIDGAGRNNAKRREELIRVSGIRGQFPQIFMVDNYGKTKYVGNYDTFEKLLSDYGRLSPGILNPDVAVDTSFFSI
mmetsp:Transcript_24375/g.29991  ORF Transcript_24375/g.29991 Transcript_24375/m.29991 type:complete len:468 (-) Transcript_24375:45-1448(-)